MIYFTDYKIANKLMAELKKATVREFQTEKTYTLFDNNRNIVKFTFENELFKVELIHG